MMKVFANVVRILTHWCFVLVWPWFKSNLGCKNVFVIYEYIKSQGQNTTLLRWSHIFEQKHLHQGHYSQTWCFHQDLRRFSFRFALPNTHMGRWTIGVGEIIIHIIAVIQRTLKSGSVRTTKIAAAATARIFKSMNPTHKTYTLSEHAMKNNITIHDCFTYNAIPEMQHLINFQ